MNAQMKTLLAVQELAQRLEAIERAKFCRSGRNARHKRAGIA